MIKEPVDTMENNLLAYINRLLKKEDPHPAEVSALAELLRAFMEFESTLAARL